MSRKIYWGCLQGVRSRRSLDGLRNKPKKNFINQKITSLGVHDPRAVNFSDKTA